MWCGPTSGPAWRRAAAWSHTTSTPVECCPTSASWGTRMHTHTHTQIYEKKKLFILIRAGALELHLQLSILLPPRSPFPPCSFEVIGYGCATCVGNTAPLPESVVSAIKQVGPASCRSYPLRPPALPAILTLTLFLFLLRPPGGAGGLRRPVWEQTL